VQLPGAIAGETCSRGLDGLDERAALRESGAGPRSTERGSAGPGSRRARLRSGPSETVTGRAPRAFHRRRYREQGARFAKWRARIRISEDGAPSFLALKENCWTMARCARALQERGLVPLLEPAAVWISTTDWVPPEYYIRLVLGRGEFSRPLLDARRGT